MSLTLPAAHTWALPPNLHCLGSNHFLSIETTLAPLSGFLLQIKQAPGLRVSTLIFPTMESAFLSLIVSFRFSLALNQGPRRPGLQLGPLHITPEMELEAH